MCNSRDKQKFIQEGNVTMIKLVGMTQEEAQKWLDEKGLKVQVEIVKSDAAAGGRAHQGVLH